MVALSPGFMGLWHDVHSGSEMLACDNFLREAFRRGLI